MADQSVTTAAAPDRSPVLIGPGDLPVFCPNPAMPLWSTHPRVYLDVADSGEAMCPYCGTRYRLQGARPADGH